MKLQKLEFGQKIIREIDLFDFTSFFGLDFFLAHCVPQKSCYISIVNNNNPAPRWVGPWLLVYTRVSYLSINLTSIIWLADYNLSLISDCCCCCCDGGTHPKYIDGRHHAVFMVWGNLSSLLFPDYTLYIYDIHLLLVVGCLLLSTSRTSMAIAAFSFYDMIWRFLKPIEPLLPPNKWPLFCNIHTRQWAFKSQSMSRKKGHFLHRTGIDGPIFYLFIKLQDLF